MAGDGDRAAVWHVQKQKPEDEGRSCEMLAACPADETAEKESRLPKTRKRPHSVAIPRAVAITESVLPIPVLASTSGLFSDDDAVGSKLDRFDVQLLLA